MKRKAIITTILIIIIVIASVASIYFYNKEHKVDENKHEVEILLSEKATIADFKAKLEESLEITGEAENVECNKIGASKGVTYMISDKVIQVYEYDLDKTDELTVSNIKLAQDEGKIIMPSMNNLEINVKYNKGLVLINYENHPEKDKILEAFESL